MLRIRLQIHHETYSDMIELNRCLFTLKGHSKQPWKGNLVALKFSGTGRLYDVGVTANDISRMKKYPLNYCRHI